MAHAGVHEGAVVAHEEHGAVVGGEEPLEPLDALEVEVVGGLVEEQQVGMAQQQLGERDAHLPPARELAGRLVEVSHGKAQAAQDLLGAGVQLVSAEALVAVLRHAVALEQGVELRPVLCLGDLGLHIGEAVLERADLVGRVDDLGKRALLAREVRLLLEVADGGVTGERDGALVRALLAHQDLEKRGLAGAVGAHEAPPLARVELERGA